MRHVAGYPIPKSACQKLSKEFILDLPRMRVSLKDALESSFNFIT